MSKPQKTKAPELILSVGQVTEISHTALMPDPDQPRKSFDEQGIAALREQVGKLKQKNNDLRREIIPLEDEGCRLREQVARMPVCVGYVSNWGMMKLQEKIAGQRPTVVSPVQDSDFCHPIYIDPQEGK